MAGRTMRPARRAAADATGASGAAIMHPCRPVEVERPMPRPNLLATAFAVVLVAAACGRAAGNDPAAEAADLLTGHYDNAGQAAEGTAHRGVRLSAVAVPGQAAGEHWVYLEQASLRTPDSPFDQRLLRFRAGTEGEDAEVVAEAYRLPGIRRLAQGWVTGMLAKADLSKAEPRPGCNLYLTDEGDSWHGTTRGEGCESNRSADTKYTTREVWLFGKGLRSDERGFDAEGKQVWGPETPYAFDRRGEIEFAPAAAARDAADAAAPAPETTEAAEATEATEATEAGAAAAPAEAGD